MELLKLALESRLPFIRVVTDDLVNVQRVLGHIAQVDEGTEVTGITLPAEISNVANLKFPEGATISHVYYTNSECKSLVALYNWALEKEVTIVFVNVDPNAIYVDGGSMIPPRELVIEYLTEMGVEGSEALVQAFGGMSLKDVGEVARMTVTRDSELTVRGINETRQGYKTLQGISQVDTAQNFYDCPPELGKWMSDNQEFFMNPVSPDLIPRGLLLDGPPGTGKTEASKFVANVFGVPLYRLDLGAMMGKYVGTSENNLNAALAQIDEVQPCVVIFDEVEKVFQQSSDSGVSSRMLSQILWWLQGHKSRVFTMMTTNDKSVIPEELYREGRIDSTMEFLGLPNLNAAQPFAKTGMDKLLESMGQEVPPSAYKALEGVVKGLFLEGKPVPQSKVAEAVKALVRQAITAKAKGTELEDTKPLEIMGEGIKPGKAPKLTPGKIKAPATTTA